MSAYTVDTVIAGEFIGYQFFCSNGELYIAPAGQTEGRIHINRETVSEHKLMGTLNDRDGGEVAKRGCLGSLLGGGIGALFLGATAPVNPHYIVSVTLKGRGALTLYLSENSYRLLSFALA